jgi:hypothetical protein
MPDSMKRFWWLILVHKTAWNVVLVSSSVSRDGKKPQCSVGPISQNMQCCLLRRRVGSNVAYPSLQNEGRQHYAYHKCLGWSYIGVSEAPNLFLNSKFLLMMQCRETPLATDVSTITLEAETTGFSACTENRQISHECPNYCTQECPGEECRKSIQRVRISPYFMFNLVVIPLQICISSWVLFALWIHVPGSCIFSALIWM